MSLREKIEALRAATAHDIGREGPGQPYVDNVLRNLLNHLEAILAESDR